MLRFVLGVGTGFTTASLLCAVVHHLSLWWAASSGVLTLALLRYMRRRDQIVSDADLPDAFRVDKDV